MGEYCGLHKATRDFSHANIPYNNTTTTANVKMLLFNKQPVTVPYTSPVLNKLAQRLPYRNQKPKTQTAWSAANPNVRNVFLSLQDLPGYQPLARSGREMRGKEGKKEINGIVWRRVWLHVSSRVSEMYACVWSDQQHMNGETKAQTVSWPGRQKIDGQHS